MGRPTSLRTMYDSVNAYNIPPAAGIVAGYVPPSSFAWTPAEWDVFPNAIKVTITPQVSGDADVLDVEPRDATAGQVPGWLVRQRNAGRIPSVYTSYSNWAAVQAAVNAAGIKHPPYWIADYSQNVDTWWPSLNGIDAVAWQYTDHSNLYDISLVAPYWEGIDGMTASLGGEQAAQLQALYDSLWTTANTAYKETLYDSLNNIQQQLTVLQAAVAALQAPTLKGVVSGTLTIQ